MLLENLEGEMWSTKGTQESPAEYLQWFQAVEAGVQAGLSYKTRPFGNWVAPQMELHNQGTANFCVTHTHRQTFLGPRL